MKKLLLAAAIFCSTFSAKAQTWDTVINGITRPTSTGLLPSCTEVLHLSGNTIIGSTLNGVYKSTNYGDNWSNKITSGFGGYNGVRKISSGRLLALGLPVFTTDNSIAKSDDNGDTWSNSSTGLPAQTIVEDMVQTPDGKIYIACRQPAAVYVSSDNGDTWTSKSTGLPSTGFAGLYAIEALDNDTLLAGNYEGIYRSNDAGNNWTKVKATGTNTIFVIKKHPNGTIYSGHSNGVYSSTDNGITWNTASFSTSQSVYDIDFDKDQNIYTCIFTQGIAKFNSSELPLGAIATAAMGMTYPRVTALTIDETGSDPIFMASTMNSSGISGYFYRKGAVGTSISESFVQNSLSIYPNPSYQSINLAGANYDSKSTVTIYSIEGKLMMHQPFNNQSIDISKLASGFYILKVKGKNEQEVSASFQKM